MIIRSNMIRLGAAAVVTVTLFAAASGAIASPSEPVTIVGHLLDDGALRVPVAYADLNLASAAGERMLLRRVAFAADDVCAPFDIASVRFDHFDSCVRTAKQGVSGDVDQALRRAHDIALTGSSAIPMAAIAVTASLPA